MSRCGAGRCASSSCWARSLSWPHSPEPPTSGLRHDRKSPQLRLPDISSTSEGTDCICGARGTARLLSSSTRVWAVRVPGWGFVQPGVAQFTRVCSYDRAGMGYSDPGPSPRTARRIASELAELLARSGIAGPVVLVGASIAGFDVRVFASDHPERTAGLVLVDASHEDDAHEVPRMARFVPLLSTIGTLRLFDVSFDQSIESLAPSVRQFAQATRFRAAGYQASADEITHIRESAEQVRSSRRKLTIPVLVVTGARGADENWRRSQQDQASLSERGCLIVAQQSGHVVAADQPEIVVDAIRRAVETARGHDVPLCPTPAANADQSPRRQ